MSDYLTYLQKISNPKTFKRKYDYFRYNYGKLLFSEKNNVESVLEIGPGLGEFIAYLNSRKIRNIDIIDNDENILNYNKSKFRINRTFQTSRLINIEKELSNYDAIVLTQVLEHIPKEQYKEFLTILFDHLNENGIIIITVPNMANPFTLCERYADLTHYNGFTDVSLKELVNYCNLKKAKAFVKNFDIPPYSMVNIIRGIIQNILHKLILLLSIANGGTYSKFLTPNITLIIKK